MPGLILITVWSVIAPVVVLERPPGLGALKRSRELVRGNGWPVFGVIVVLVVGVNVVGGSRSRCWATRPGTGAGIVVTVVVQILTAPLAALAASVLYFELLRQGAGRSPLPPRARRSTRCDSPIHAAQAKPELKGDYDWRVSLTMRGL